MASFSEWAVGQPFESPSPSRGCATCGSSRSAHGSPAGAHHRVHVFYEPELGQLNPQLPGVLPRQDQACGPLRIIILMTNTEEAPSEVGNISVPASPPQISSMMQAMTISIIYTSQMEAGTAASSPIHQDSGTQERWP